jgi:hypothetical protein
MRLIRICQRIGEAGRQGLLHEEYTGKQDHQANPANLLLSWAPEGRLEHGING